MDDHMDRPLARAGQGEEYLIQLLLKFFLGKTCLGQGDKSTNILLSRKRGKRHSIYQNSKLLAPGVCITEMVLTIQFNPKELGLFGQSNQQAMCLQIDALLSYIYTVEKDKRKSLEKSEIEEKRTPNRKSIVLTKIR